MLTGTKKEGETNAQEKLLKSERESEPFYRLLSRRIAALPEATPTCGADFVLHVDDPTRLHNAGSSFSPSNLDNLRRQCPTSELELNETPASHIFKSEEKPAGRAKAPHVGQLQNDRVNFSVVGGITGTVRRRSNFVEDDPHTKSCSPATTIGG